MLKNIITGEVIKSVNALADKLNVSRYKLQTAIDTHTSEWQPKFEEKPYTYTYDFTLSDDPRDSFIISPFITDKGTISRGWTSHTKVDMVLEKFPEYERLFEYFETEGKTRNYKRVKLVSLPAKRLAKVNVYQVTNQWYIGETTWSDDIVLSILWRLNHIFLNTKFELELYSPEYISRIAHLPLELVKETYHKFTLTTLNRRLIANEGLTEIFDFDYGNDTLLEDFKGRTILDNGHCNPFVLMENSNFNQSVVNRNLYIDFYLENSTEQEDIKQSKAVWFKNYVNFDIQEKQHKFSVEVEKPEDMSKFKGFAQYGDKAIMAERTANELLEVKELITEKNKQVMPSVVFEQGTLTDSQYEAVKQLLPKNVVVLTGMAGSGKTYTTSRLIEILGYTYKTRKPATQDALVVSIANRAGENFKEQAGKLHLNLDTASVNKTKFHPEVVKDAKLIIVEEASQLTVHQLHDLMMINKTARYIFVGDVNQLPPIDGLSALQFLQDNGVEVVTIGHNVRQGDNSPILKDANDILKQKLPAFDTDKSTIKYQSDLTLILDTKADVYLALDNYTVQNINDRLHERAVEKKNKVKVGGTWYVQGEKIIITQGTKAAKDLGFVNGTILTVCVGSGKLSFKLNNKRYKQGKDIDIEQLEHSFAYAMTIFYAQGSTFDNVVTILGSSKNISNNAIYTAITRAAKKHTFFVKEEAQFVNGLEYKIEDEKFDINKVVRKDIDPFTL